MKTITLLFTLLLSTIAFSQNFKITTDPVKKIIEFKEIKNDTIEVMVLYKNNVLKGKRIVKGVKCTYDYDQKLEGLIFKKISHYLINGKEVDRDEIIFDMNLNFGTITDSGFLFYN